MTVQSVKLKDGRSYSVDENGAADDKLLFQVVLASPLERSEQPTSFTGIPAIGSKHPVRAGLYAVKYNVRQPRGSAKSTLDVEVIYAPSDAASNIDPEDPTSSEQQITEWGWDDGTTEAELVWDAEDSSKPVVNSAGDPFDRAPSHLVPTPTFTKVLRTSSRLDYADYICKINDAPVTIGGITYPIHTLLCTIAESRNIGETAFPYEYRIRLRYKSQKVKVGGSGSLVEVGWNIPVVDAGMREIKDGTLQLIQVVSGETGRPATVTSPELLDGQGGAVARSASGGAPTPFVMVFAGYQEESFPNWLYSEPPIPSVAQAQNDQEQQEAS